VQTSTPQFVLLCQLLVQAMEDVPEEQRLNKREAILDTLMGHLMREGLVFDRAYAGQLFDQLSTDPETLLQPVTSARLDELKSRVRQSTYVTEAMLTSLGDRLLWVLGSS
jgi:hypothetical protein